MTESSGSPGNLSLIGCAERNLLEHEIKRLKGLLAKKESRKEESTLKRVELDLDKVMKVIYEYSRDYDRIIPCHGLAKRIQEAKCIKFKGEKQ